jgi:hypothetical protein
LRVGSKYWESHEQKEEQRYMFEASWHEKKHVGLLFPTVEDLIKFKNKIATENF